MRRLLLFCCLFLSSLNIWGQTPVGTWSDHLVYSKALNLAVGSEEVFASTGSSLIVFNKEYSELRKLSRVNGLSETIISTIAFSEEYNILVIAYSNTNIDILKNNIIYNIPDIRLKYIPGEKEINKIRIRGEYAYLACSFGIVLIDLNKNEIYDTWKPGDGTDDPEIWDIAFSSDKVYAATTKGVYLGDIDDPGLAYFGNWSLINTLPEPEGKYTAAVFAGNRLYVNHTGNLLPGDYIYYIGNETALFSYVPGRFNSSFDKAADGFIVASGNSARYYHDDGSLYKTISSYPWGIPNIAQAVEDDDDIWIADISSGLVRWENMSDFSAYTLPGPSSNNAISVTSLNGKTIICGGGVNIPWNNLWRPFNVSVYEANSWTHINSTVRDPMRAFIDPADNTHFFIATWGGGLLEYRDNELINTYNDSNSPLQTIIPGQPYVRICGMAMDGAGNLWITQSEVPGSVKVLKPDGTWIVNPVTATVATIGDIIITRSGHKWIVLPRGNGLLIIDDNDTPEYFNDDIYKQMFLTDPDGKVITFVYSIAEDLDGNIWVGTDQGPYIYYNPDEIINDDIRAYRIKVPRDDGSGLADYVLATEAITSIAIDGANRKWLGTQSSGAYLLSPDGTIRIKNYNMQNSPILSDVITDISVDNLTGDVFFATSDGVISIRGDAITGKDEFTGVYSFPNPVRKDYTENVTITGLMRDTQIKITDISGNLVYETVSAGGQASWDLTTYHGRRVATGVYLVFCSSRDGGKSCITKILVVN
jgi:hypothetical protein